MGFNRVVEIAVGGDPTTGGRFQMRDRYKAPIQAAPIYAQTEGTDIKIPDWGFPHEVFYPETGQIQFDLYNVFRDTNPATAQIGFQGVRRLPGSIAPRPGFRARPKTFTYVTYSPPLAGLVGADAVYLRQPVNDYDFELHNIELVTNLPDSVTYGGVESTLVRFARKPGGTGDVTVQIVVAGVNTPFSFVVTPDSITVNANTDAFGTSITGNGNLLLAAYAASPLAQSLVFLTVTDLLNSLAAGGPTVLGPGGTFSTLTAPLSKLWIYDSNKVTISSVPMLDIYCDGSPGGVYQDGALVPPLYYPKDSLIQIGFYSLLTDTSLIGTRYAVHLVGKQYIPC